MQRKLKILYNCELNCKWAACDTSGKCQERVRVKRQKWIRALRFGSTSKNSRRASGNPAALHSFFAHPAIPPSAPCPSACCTPHGSIPHQVPHPTAHHHPPVLQPPSARGGFCQLLATLHSSTWIANFETNCHRTSTIHRPRHDRDLVSERCSRVSFAKITVAAWRLGHTSRRSIVRTSEQRQLSRGGHNTGCFPAISSFETSRCWSPGSFQLACPDKV